MKKTTLFTTLLMFSLLAAPIRAAYAASSDPEACLSEDKSETEETWPTFERSIPDCKRAVVILQAGARLDLGEHPLLHRFSTGVIAFKAEIISGSGSYSADGKVHDLKGATIWISQNRCEVKRLILRDGDNRDITGFKKVRYIETTDDGVSGISDGDQFKDFKNFCS